MAHAFHEPDKLMKLLRPDGAPASHIPNVSFEDEDWPDVEAIERG
jgi:hypothetical protein